MRRDRATGRLALNRETVRQMESSEIEQANGGQASVVCSLQWGCLPSQAGCTGYYPSWNAPCSAGTC